MTERAGAALSHVLIRVGPIALFGASGAANFSPPPDQDHASRKSQAAIGSAAGRMAA